MSSEPDAQTKAVLKQIAEKPFLDPSMSIAQMRDGFDRFHRSVELPRTESVTTEDRTIVGPGGDLRLRIYTPRDASSQSLPVLVYYHGGGMMMGGLDSHDTICRRIADQAQAIVVATDYRLAPENRFPAPVDDAYAALVWCHSNAPAFGGDPARLAIGGDSAGGNLAAVVAQLARDRKGPALAFQLLIYPAVGISGRGNSIDLRGYFFEKDALDWLYSQYLDDPATALNPMVSPVLAKDLSNLPPAFVVTAEYDILRDDDEYYVERLRAAGVAADLHRYEGTIHGFISMAGAIDSGGEAIDECALKLREAFSPSASEAYQVMADNDHVRVMRVTCARGDAAPAYSPAADTRGRVQTAGEGWGMVEYYRGKWPEPAGGRTTGDISEIRVELKKPVRTSAMPMDAVRVDPKRYLVELENDRVRVVRLRFEGHEQGLMVTHPPRVLVTLTAVRVGLRFADGRTDERGAPAGVAGWLEEETLQTRNLGDSPLEVVLIEPKG